MRSDAELLSYFGDLKLRNKFVAIDAHTNPGDVFSVEQGVNVAPGTQLQGPSLLEKLDYSRPALVLLDLLFRLYPSYLIKEIVQRYINADQFYFLNQLNTAHIDLAVGLPALSAQDPMIIFDSFTDSRILRLGTVDVHTVAAVDIDAEIARQVLQHNIIGLKFNSNIQKFFPEPNRNSAEVNAALEAVYASAEKHNLFLLFHAGCSYVNESGRFRKRIYGRLENFFDISGGSSFIFGLKTQVIVAHMGHYNEFRVRWDLLEQLVEHPNVFFDTCGVSTTLTKRFIQTYGYNRVLFGSDMMYFDVRYAVIRMLRILSSLYRNKMLDKAVIAIFSKNFAENLMPNGVRHTFLQRP